MRATDRVSTDTRPGKPLFLDSGASARPPRAQVPETGARGTPSLSAARSPAARPSREPLCSRCRHTRAMPSLMKSRGFHKYHFGLEYSGGFSTSLKIACLLLSILREPTPGLHLGAKYSSLARFNGTKVSRPLSRAHGMTFQGGRRQDSEGLRGGRDSWAPPSGRVCGTHWQSGCPGSVPE